MDINKENLSPEVLAYIKELQSQNKKLHNKVEDLKNKLDLAIMKRFGKSSEKISPLQPELFEELTIKELEEIIEEIMVPEHARKKRGRKPISDKIPRKEIIHDISEEGKKYACGCDMSKIDDNVHTAGNREATCNPRIDICRETYQIQVRM